MNPQKRNRILLIALVVVLLAGLITVTIHYNDLPTGFHNTKPSS